MREAKPLAGFGGKTKKSVKMEYYQLLFLKWVSLSKCEAFVQPLQMMVVNDESIFDLKTRGFDVMFREIYDKGIVISTMPNLNDCSIYTGSKTSPSAIGTDIVMSEHFRDIIPDRNGL